ncbi:MAG: ABC transporter ATP-binding protein [Desulfosarcina sp.]|nr:ABC transporter ATP-binding protein [Desulfobacterales bacterium]
MSFTVNKISKCYDELEVLADISFDVDENKIVSLLGPSGCGKTTLLNIFSGITTPDAGRLTGFKADNTCYLFQEPRLLKWKTVEENIDFVLKDKMTQEERKNVIEKNLEIVGLQQYRNFYISQLSGGMKQRVAIARAFAFPAGIMLMDEPFKSLDLDLRASLIKSFTALWSMNQRSVFFVTHDIHAAIILGDDIFVLSEKPARIQKHIKNRVPLDERNLRNPDILEIEKQLYDHFSYFR